ncbi:MAG: glycosyltransferase family 4 protein [Methanomicrobiales archaeon]|nr:glycosyltransferase family 4 protein [Methanomicrobiales archaeon]
MFYPDNSGHAMHVSELAREINPHLREQTIVAPRLDGEFREYDARLGVPIERIDAVLVKSPALRRVPGVPTLNALYYAWNAAKRVAGRKGIDLVHVHGLILGQFLLLLLRARGIRVPVVIASQGAPALITQPRVTWTLMRGLQALLFRLVRPDHVVQLDDGNMDAAFMDELKARGIPCTVVFHAIDTDRFAPPPARGSADGCVILSNHRFVPFKRVDLAIQAFNRLVRCDGGDGALLKLAGSGPLRTELERMVKDSGLSDRVEFIGEKPLDAIGQEIAAADIVVGTSTISNVNRSIQEAMACGRAVVVFDSGGTTIFRNGENAITVPPGDVGAFAEGLQRLIRDPALRERLGACARETILQQRSWKRRIAQELEVYRRVLGRGSESCGDYSAAR